MNSFAARALSLFTGPRLYTADDDLVLVSWGRIIRGEPVSAEDRASLPDGLVWHEFPDET